MSIAQPNILKFTAICLLLPTTVSADDWNQWQGPNRNSVWEEDGLIDSFPEKGATIKWRANVSTGYSGPAVADNRVFVHDYLRTAGDPRPNPGTMSELQGSERVTCLDASTGELLWRFEYECAYKVSYPSGPRITPTVDGDRVYTLGVEGNLHCLNVKDGSVIWARELKKDYGIPQVQTWGFAGHPLVDGDKLFCLVGGEGSVAVAFDKMTGKELWRNLSAEDPGYCPPTLIQAGGTNQLIIWHASALNSLNPETGEVYWSFPIEPAYGMSILAPIHYGNHLLVDGYGQKAMLVELDQEKPAATVVWRDRGVNPSHSTGFVQDGVYYCVDGKGFLHAVDLQTGDRRWRTLEPTTGGRPRDEATLFTVKNGDRYFMFNDQGELIIAELSPEGYRERSRAKILEPTAPGHRMPVVWSHPAYANKCVFARNDEEIVCVSLAK